MITLEIKTKDFINWYFYTGCDQEQEELAKNLGDSVIERLLDDGICTISVEQFLECNVDLIPMSIIQGLEHVEGCIEDNFDPNLELKINLI
jgi:hypothetical protein